MNFKIPRKSRTETTKNVLKVERVNSFHSHILRETEDVREKNIEKQNISSLCRISGVKESVGHLICDCSKLAQNEYKYNSKKKTTVFNLQYVSTYSCHLQLQMSFFNSCTLEFIFKYVTKLCQNLRTI